MSLWSISKSLQIPLDPKIKELIDVPYTISYVIRKRQQIDNLHEMPKNKQPPEKMIWEGTSEDLESWIERVFYKNEPAVTDIIIDTIEED